MLVKKQTKKLETRAERNIKWIEKHCRIPEGKDVANVKVADFPTKDHVQGLRQSSWYAPRNHLGRAQECPALSAFLLLLHLCGPEAKHNSQLFSAAQFARPIVRRGASLDADQAPWQLLEERQEVATLQPPADNYLTSGINCMNLEDRLGDIETDCRDRVHE